MSKKSRGKKHKKHTFLKLIGLFFVAAFLLDVFVDGTQGLSDYEKQRLERQRFINSIVNEVRIDQGRTGVLSSVTMAQAILESDWGNSQLASKYNNYFGVKTDSENPGEYIDLPTKEFRDGQWVKVTQRFAQYPSFRASLQAHNDLFVNGTTWNKDQYSHVLNAQNYEEAVYALETDGYATDPEYGKKLLKIIRENDLAKYDE